MSLAVDTETRPVPARRGYSINEFVELTSLSRATFYVLLNSRRIKTVKVLGKTLVPAEEIERLMRDGAPSKVA